MGNSMALSVHFIPKTSLAGVIQVLSAILHPVVHSLQCSIDTTNCVGYEFANDV